MRMTLAAILLSGIPLSALGLTADYRISFDPKVVYGSTITYLDQELPNGWEINGIIDVRSDPTRETFELEDIVSHSIRYGQVGGGSGRVVRILSMSIPKDTSVLQGTSLRIESELLDSRSCIYYEYAAIECSSIMWSDYVSGAKITIRPTSYEPETPPVLTPVPVGSTALFLLSSVAVLTVGMAASRANRIAQAYPLGRMQDYRG